jgi:hypothetical protein
MFAVVQNGEVRQILQLDVPFSVGDKHYSSNFLRTSSAQEKVEAGVWEIVEGARPDDRFYWVSGPNYRVVEVSNTVEANYSGTAKQLDDVTENEVTTTGLKSQFVAQIKSGANSILQPTDWMVIRKVERNVDIPAETAAYRAAVLAECDRICAAILAATTVEELATVMTTQNWPAPA